MVTDSCIAAPSSSLDVGFVGGFGVGCFGFLLYRHQDDIDIYIDIEHDLTLGEGEKVGNGAVLFSILL